MGPHNNPLWLESPSSCTHAEAPNTGIGYHWIGSLTACLRRLGHRQPPPTTTNPHHHHHTTLGGWWVDGWVGGVCGLLSSVVVIFSLSISSNDPAAGSPTATLLRLLLPLAEEHHPASIGACPFSTCFYPNAIGSNDGRCVQMAGTQSIQADDLGILGIPRSRDTVAIIYPHHVSGLQGFPASSGHGAVGEPLPSWWLLH